MLPDPPLLDPEVVPEELLPGLEIPLLVVSGADPVKPGFEMPLSVEPGLPGLPTVPGA